MTSHYDRSSTSHRLHGVSLWRGLSRHFISALIPPFHSPLPSLQPSLIAPGHHVKRKQPASINNARHLKPARLCSYQAMRYEVHDNIQKHHQHSVILILGYAHAPIKLISLISLLLPRVHTSHTPLSFPVSLPLS